MARPPRIPNWLPWEQRTVYLITFCVAARKPVLATAKTWTICRAVLQRLDRWRPLAFIMLPDHIHLVLAPIERDASVSAFSKWFKRWFNESYWKSALRPHSWQWQEGCFDRLLRSDESLSQKWEYLRQNPVQAGLVDRPEDWPYQYAANFADEKL